MPVESLAAEAHNIETEKLKMGEKATARLADSIDSTNRRHRGPPSIPSLVDPLKFSDARALACAKLCKELRAASYRLRLGPSNDALTRPACAAGRQNRLPSAWVRPL